MFYLDAIYGSGLGKYLGGLVEKNPEALIMPTLPTFKTPLKYDHKRHSIVGHVNAVIAGSGASACVAAHELQRAGLKVLVVEKGPFVIPGSKDITADFNFFESNGPRFSEDGSIAILNAEVGGGGPSINANMSFAPTLPVVKYQFDQWHEQGILANAWHETDIHQAYAWVKSIFKPRIIDPIEINMNNRVLFNGARALNISPKLYELNSYAPGKSPHSVNNKKSSLDLLLIPSMLAHENPVTMLNNCKVEKVLIEQGRAVGLLCTYQTKKSYGVVSDLYGFNIPEEQKVSIYADHVIIAAGNLGSSGILLSSDIDNSNIGVGFVNHPFITVMGKFDQHIMLHEGEASTIYVDEFAKTKEHPDKPGFLLEAHSIKPGFGALLHPGDPRQILEITKDFSNWAGFSVMLIDTPHRGNRIERTKDGKLKVYYELLQTDKDRFLIGLKTAIKILFAAGASKVTFNSFERPQFLYDKIHANDITADMDLDEMFYNFDFVRNQTMLFGVHMMAGNKMGRDSKTSVVDENYQVWGIDNLYVIDSSVFPASVGANPMQTIYTTAKLFTENFLKSFNQ